MWALGKCPGAAGLQHFRGLHYTCKASLESSKDEKTRETSKEEEKNNNQRQQHLTSIHGACSSLH